MKKGGTVKKYQAGGAMKSSPRPRMRPDDMEGGMAPKRSKRPQMRPKYMEEEAGAVARGDRAYRREMEDMPPKGMKKGGKVRGCGMARGGAVRQCKMVKMKGS